MKDVRVAVTGGASGIGAAVVADCARKGARVVSLDIDDEAGSRIATDAAQESGSAVSYLHCDVARTESVAEAFDGVKRELGGLDAVVHLSGVLRHCPAEDLTVADVTDLMRINFIGTVLVNQASFRIMRSTGGRILNAGSDAALEGHPLGAHYAASKGAVISWTRTAAREWGKYGISVNALAPAAWTPMYKAFRSRMAPHELAIHDEVMRDEVPLGGRLGSPENDVAPVVALLVSRDAAFLTGQVIAANGGKVMVR